MKCFICSYFHSRIINISECKEHIKYNYDKIRHDIFLFYSEL